jgi:2Fe-2S ferredoxin
MKKYYGFIPYLNFFTDLFFLFAHNIQVMKTHEIEFIFEESHKKPTIIKAVEGESILEAALDAGIHIQHNCGGVCACTTCHVYIEEGMKNLSEMSEKEEDRVDLADNVKLESRLACQCLVYGKVKVLVPDQSGYLGH